MALASVGTGTQIWNNNIRSFVLLAFYPLIVLAVVWVGFFIAAKGHEWTADQYWSRTVAFLLGYGWAILLAIACWLVIAYFLNARMTRALCGAREVTRADEPELYHVLETLCIARGVPVPRLSIVETHARNAFASGVDERSFQITVTRGLLQSLPEDEVEAVLAHELAHILNRDVRLLTVCIIFTGMFGFAAQTLNRMLRGFGRSRVHVGTSRSKKGGGQIMLFLYAMLAVLWVAYFMSLVARFAISRVREYSADAGGIELTKKPEAMMRALLRISGHDRIPDTTDEVAMMCVVNTRRPFLGLFRTHPAMQDRVRRISEMSRTPEPASPLRPVGRGRSFQPPAPVPTRKNRVRIGRHGRSSVPQTVAAPASVPGTGGVGVPGAVSVQPEQLHPHEDRG